MKLNGKTALLCSCEDTMPLDPAGLAAALGSEAATPFRQLCRSQLDGFRAALQEGEVIVACAQEAPLFAQVAEGRAARFVDIRDRAGWSDEAASAMPKMAALLAEAAIDAPPVPVLGLESEGSVLVYGHDEVALALASRLAARGQAVTCVLGRPDGLLPPASRDFVLAKGTVRQVQGHLGAFTATIAGMVSPAAASRGALLFPAGGADQTLSFDLILDVSGDKPLFPRAARRDGYVRAEPGSPVACERALLEVIELVGVFDKPRYVTVDTALCAHARNQITACTRCIDACPGGSIRPDGDAVTVTAETCFGHGTCTTACPTGAIRFTAANALPRLRTQLATYRRAGGEAPLLLVHDRRHGDELIRLMARLGPGLPANVLPFAVDELGAAGLDLMLTALAHGAAGLLLVAAPAEAGTLTAVEGTIVLADAIAAGLGYGAGRVVLSHEADPLALASALRRQIAALPGEVAEYLVGGRKRDVLGLALRHLHRHAPAPVDALELPAGAPFGAVVLDAGRCTLCMSCTSVCPAGALSANPDKPQLGFLESACVQCGLCRATCPEKAIALTPRLDFTESARQRRVLKEEEAFCCIKCGKPFGARAAIERMIAKLSDHSMFQEPGRLDVLRMCEDCRVVAQFEPAAGSRPVPRTTEDYLRERDPAVQH